MTRLLDISEVAKRLGCTPRHVSNLMRAGDAPPSIQLGRLRRFPEAAVDAWIADKLAEATSKK